MTQNHDSNPYIVALRNSQESTTPSTAATKLSTPRADPSYLRAESTPSYSGPEKRRSSRYQCDGVLEMREEGCDVPTWARFTDISLHGCYVEAQATYPPGTILHMKLEADGISIESKGDVRVSYPYLGMGIAFVEMSDENKIRLKQLLGVVSRGASAGSIAVAPPQQKSLQSLATVSDPSAAIQALIQFFEHHPMLARSEFLQMINASQTTPESR